MEEILKYLTKTNNALQSLKETAEELENTALDELQQKTILKEDISLLKQEFRDKADRIDSIIKTLDGALK